MAVFLHTSDWHLGRILHGTHLTLDQSVLLEEIGDITEAEKPDALIIAGDVYDRAVPPPEAVALLDAFLKRVIGELQIPVVMIAGNHDSPERLAFGSSILSSQGLWVSGSMELAPPLCIEDAHGPLEIWSLPYVAPGRVRELLGDPTIRGHQSATAAMCDLVRSRTSAPRSVLVSHAFVTGGTTCDSERPLSVGGAGTVDASAFEGFSYVALGHLHRAQQVGSGPLHYAGSPAKYSISEISHKKSLNRVEIDAEGCAQVSRIPLKGARDLRRVSGRLDDLLAGPVQGNPNDYVVAELTDEGPVRSAIARLREFYPRVLHIERATVEQKTATSPSELQVRKLSIAELFDGFYQAAQGRELTEEERQVMADIIEPIQGDCR